jgi:hypothetical protein
VLTANLKTPLVGLVVMVPPVVFVLKSEYGEPCLKAKEEAALIRKLDIALP